MTNLYIPLLAIISHEAMGSRTKGGSFCNFAKTSVLCEKNDRSLIYPGLNSYPLVI
jgi:hypothetical protein